MVCFKLFPKVYLISTQTSNTHHGISGQAYSTRNFVETQYTRNIENVVSLKVYKSLISPQSNTPAIILVTS